jgi:phosphohistidine swiveling domain-containing protein
MDLVVTLAQAARLGPHVVGAKAANLGQLADRGLPVPPGVVVTPAGLARWEQAAGELATAVVGLGAELGVDRFAVRSSGIAEDLADASFAGQYETLLDVPLDAVADAVRRVAASASADRVAAYQRAHGTAAAGSPPMAVLVQPMIAAEAAGVAFTANPVTGDRDQVVVTAVRGLGERLVAGEAVGDEWVVHDQQITPRRVSEQALTAEQTRAVAALARRVETVLGSPQDIEWAIADGRLWLLQARPMTALPEPVDWTPPRPGWWRRDFRLGEWLPEPVTPLFADWLLPALEEGSAAAMATGAEAGLRFEWALLDGWYYTTPTPRPARGSLLGHLLRHPRTLLGLPALVRLLLRPDLAGDELTRLTNHWRGELLPRYRTLVADTQARLAQAPPVEPAALTDIADAVAAVAGEYLWSTWILAGSAWKVEATLARFCRRHLPTVEVSAQLLVSGLPGAEPEHAGHAVHSLDWVWPTLGETDPIGGQADNLLQARRRHAELAARRQAAEARCRSAVASRPRRRRRFDRLLAAAQHFAVIREQQTRALTLGWPLLRRCVLGLAEPLCQHGLLGQATDAFFCTRAELRTDGRATNVPGQAAEPDDTVPGSLQATVDQRRARWQRQRGLAAPLQLGRPPALAALLFRRRFAGYATPAASPTADALVVGQPASPGRATGRARVLTDPSGFASFQPGEVLVAPATTPAWTPLFAIAAAVVTDSGTLAAHASLVAREYGIPAVVGTGQATHRLHTGQHVTVDGHTGVVTPARTAPSQGGR